MLTSEIKQRINTCRDILVGKLPDPKSQVLQITNALIYKFMDDQDRLAEQLGGKPSFFVNDLEPYAWHKLFDSRLDNQDRAEKYIEGLEKLSNAKHLPDLFKEIFKEAYLPFKAAATITMFLDEINKFDYTHSEELGNAYEYLLNIMGSQGDAGQFRTPRHVIDFLVDVVNPKKDETIYDPAAGTAGFLISAYKHILEENEELSATELKNISKNISGVDISPDMAKMARVNLYLHGFLSPHIDEGDTLSEEPLWGKKQDVILANPPFMTPKGGIIPHEKFGIKAKRAEVLFVDYIAEHLKLKGRAGIIVPEGIIFQSGSAYKELRKMLIEDGYLHSVISLPAGVFQPYSGVKTSILILDRERAKEASEILFLKIENDGYSLGAQRTEKEGSELPQALAIARAWQSGKKEESPIASWVTKKEIADSDDYNLTGERYRAFDEKNTEWPILTLGEVCDIYNGSTPKRSNESYWENGDVPWFTVDDIRNQGRQISETKQNITQKALKETSIKLLPKNSVLLCCTASVGEYAFANTPLTTNQQFNGLVVNNEYKGKLVPKFLFWLVSTFKDELERVSGKTSFNFVSVGVLKKIKIPLPPIEVQKEMVAELDRYQKIIDGARQVVENYKPSFKIKPDWTTSELGDLFEMQNGRAFKKTEWSTTGLPIIRIANLNNEKAEFNYYSGDYDKKIEVNNNELLFSWSGTIGTSFGPHLWERDRGLLNQHIYIFKPKKKNISYKFAYYALLNITPQIESKAHGAGGLVHVTKTELKKFKIPTPPLKTQEEVVKVIDNERMHIASSQKLVDLFEQKIQDKIAEVWGE